MVRDDLIDLLRTRGPLRMCEVARALGRDPRTVSRARDQLLRQGKVLVDGEGQGALLRLAAHIGPDRPDIGPDRPDIGPDRSGGKGAEALSVVESSSLSGKELRDDNDRRTITGIPAEQVRTVRTDVRTFGCPSCRPMRAMLLELEAENLELHDLLTRARGLLGDRGPRLERAGVEYREPVSVPSRPSALEVRATPVADGDDFEACVEEALEEAKKGGKKIRKVDDYREGIRRNLRAEPDKLVPLMNIVREKRQRAAEGKARAERLKAEGRPPISIAALAAKTIAPMPQAPRETWEEAGQ